MRFRPAWAAPASGAPISITAIQPDVTTLAKPLAGGLPLGAVLCTEEVARAIHAGMHGTTFGGGPLACAVGIAVIDTIEKEGLLAHATEVGDYFLESLRNWPRSMRRLSMCAEKA